MSPGEARRGGAGYGIGVGYRPTTGGTVTHHLSISSDRCEDAYNHHLCNDMSATNKRKRSDVGGPVNGLEPSKRNASAGKELKKMAVACTACRKQKVSVSELTCI